MNYRNKKLLSLANGAPCMNCGNQDGTVVAAHANSSEYGKGMAIKAHDWAIAYLCHRCHAELDNGKSMSREDRMNLFARAALKTHGWLYQTGKVEIK